MVKRINQMSSPKGKKMLKSKHDTESNKEHKLNIKMMENELILMRKKRQL